MIIVYIDIILLVILLVLSLSTCAYCCLRVHRLRQSGQLTILLRPTKVIFSNKKENDGNDELRTVVAYRNPFTGDYCVHKHREPRGYENEMARCGPRGESETARCDTESADSGLSDEYEPLNVVPQKVRE
ncbi:uncharacterized protein LOC105389871 [Plutella xylostella]|uniref:uncharacterized protein LOC105389871 n=1 Tax=Plutella xylostella TaxID=51655 RepID=UPI0020327CB1|nr:uncharacterized protein LOC105389871 [Plutella xylostella]